MNGIGVLIGLYAIVLGFLGIFAPQLLFKLRHPISVTKESQLSGSGVVLYRLGGILSIIIGLFVMAAI